MLAEFVRVSQSSIHRYRAGQRVTPDQVAARLHFLALVTSDLAGSYSEIGVRRWFQRSRSALGGNAVTPGQQVFDQRITDPVDPDRSPDGHRSGRRRRVVVHDQAASRSA